MLSLAGQGGSGNVSLGGPSTKAADTSGPPPAAGAPGPAPGGGGAAYPAQQQVAQQMVNQAMHGAGRVLRRGAGEIRVYVQANPYSVTMMSFFGGPRGKGPIPIRSARPPRHRQHGLSVHDSPSSPIGLPDWPEHCAPALGQGWGASSGEVDWGGPKIGQKSGAGGVRKIRPAPASRWAASPTPWVAPPTL